MFRMIQSQEEAEPQGIATYARALSWFGFVTLVVLEHLLAFVPLVTVLMLHLLSWRATFDIGHWPQPTLDDPKFIVTGDPVYEMLFNAAGPLLVSSCFLIPLFIVLNST